MSGHIYLIEFDDETIKAGFTTKPETRLKQHASAAACFGIEVAYAWFSPLHIQAGENEARLLEFCRAAADSVRKAEYFVGLDLDLAIRFASRLPMGMDLSGFRLTREQWLAPDPEESAPEPHFPAGEFR